MRDDRTSRALSRLRLLISTILLMAPAACTGGINAGVKGGQAFIVMTGMLLLMLGILWIILGREK
ncbi:MAG: hypothetical protein M3198_14795 [Actinomycetota bacterium]|nr:hypothetical protein [Actinomycetota bacterium]